MGLRVRRAANVGDRILVDGNTAAALGAVYGGATVCAWYPITPSTQMGEYWAEAVASAMSSGVSAKAAGA